MELTEEAAQFIQDCIVAQQIADAKEYDIIPTLFDRREDFNSFRTTTQELAA